MNLDDKRATATDAQNTDNRLSEFFTMRCDICSDTKFSSFQHAKQHYKSVHGVTGYLVCCNKKFVKAKTVDNHLQWHINPELNKYVPGFLFSPNSILKLIICNCF